MCKHEPIHRVHRSLQDAEIETDGILTVDTKIRLEVDTDGVELIDAGDDLVIQRSCPITWVGCQIIISKRTGQFTFTPPQTPQQTAQ
jgi:hypothetical protein